MGTVIPQSELTRRAIDWISEQAGPGASPAQLRQQIEAAAMRFNLSPGDAEFLERFFASCAASGQKS